jgi:hypothetical protein
MSEKIGDVPESKQNRENEKIFFLSFLYKEAAKKIFFRSLFYKRKEKTKKTNFTGAAAPGGRPAVQGRKIFLIVDL